MNCLKYGCIINECCNINADNNNVLLNDVHITESVSIVHIQVGIFIKLVIIINDI